jgi:uncharacterized membrane protein YccF (DUF307 family)
VNAAPDEDILLLLSQVFGGLWMALGWVIAAVVMAITIVGLPWARAGSASPSTRCCRSAKRPYRVTNISAAKTSAPVCVPKTSSILIA